MITTLQAIHILKAHFEFCRNFASTTMPDQKEHIAANQEAEALSLALSALGSRIPMSPVYNPNLHTYTCKLCGTVVGFQVRPGVRCRACPQCMQCVDWTGIELR